MKTSPHHLVLLPGLEGSGTLFGPLRSVLPPVISTTVVHYPPDEPMNYHHLVPRIREMVPWDTPYTLVAENFAGPLALQYAALQPDHVHSIVLVCSFVTKPTHPRFHWIEPWLTEHWIQKALCHKLCDKILKKFFLGEDCPDLLVTQLKDAFRSVRIDVLIYRLRMILECNALQLLHECKKPLLYLLGTQDRFVGDRGWEAIRLVRPDVPVIPIQAPHMLLQRKPREALEAMQKLLDALEEYHLKAA